MIYLVLYKKIYNQEAYSVKNDENGIFKDFCKALQQFITDCRTAQCNVPNSGLVELSKAIAESAIKIQLDLSFESFRNSLSERIMSLPNLIHNIEHNDSEGKLNIMNEFINQIIDDMKNTLCNVNVYL